MLTRKSFDHHEATEALNASLANASDMLAKTLENARTKLARASASSADVARDFGDELLVGARKAGRSTQSLVSERPMQSLLIVGAVAFALGWIGRRARELRIDREAQQTSSPRAAKARARPRTASKRATPKE